MAKYPDIVQLMLTDDLTAFARPGGHASVGATPSAEEWHRLYERTADSEEDYAGACSSPIARGAAFVRKMCLAFSRRTAAVPHQTWSIVFMSFYSRPSLRWHG